MRLTFWTSAALACALAAWGGASAAPAAPQAAAPGRPSIPPLPAYTVTPGEAADLKVVQAAMDAAQAGGLAAVAPHVAGLEQVLSHAPADYPAASQTGDRIMVRTLMGDTPPMGVTLALLTAAAVRGGGGGSVAVVAAVDTYGTAAVLLGSFYVEMHQPERALPALDRGLAIRPGDAHLTTEKAAAMVQQRRFAEIIPLLDAWLANPGQADPRDQARVLRSRGFSYVELGRLEQADADYKASLVLEPDNQGALHELQYIAGLRRGAGPTPFGLTTADKFKAGIPSKPAD